MTDLERLRHSCAHVLATAILRIWPRAQLATGPPVETGFYYDLELDHRISPEDFARIEKEMAQVCRENQRFERIVLSREEAMAMAKSGRLGGLSQRDESSKFKLDILRGIPDGEEITAYGNGDFVDLCAGPHVGYTSKCKASKVMSVASAFYKGDSDKPQLQRVYGTAFFSKTELKAYLVQLEEAKKRDHRKLGRELDLFHIDEEVGQGLILWMPKGAVIRRELEDFIAEELARQGYAQVFTPHIGKLDLYRTSGHYPFYRHSQYPPVIDRETLGGLAEEGSSCAELCNRLEKGAIDGYLLKPMNCPHHIKIFAARRRSYRDLPVRLAEFGTVYRWELSGEIGGMTRVRGFTQDDAHIFCTGQQVEDELIGCLNLVRKVLQTLGMEDYRVRLSLRDADSSKYVGQREDWDRAEESLRQAALALGAPFTEAAGEAAFYGPKIDFLVKDVIGREWQLGTVQVDYNLPERFHLSYTGADNQPHRPVMIHRAPFGSMERFVGVLIEHFGAHFPTWLAPEQIRVLTISEKHLEYAETVLAEIRAVEGLRVTMDAAGEKISAKIRLAQLEKVPYMLVIGAKEEELQQITIRHRNRGDLGSSSVSAFLDRVGKEVRERSL